MAFRSALVASLVVLVVVSGLTSIQVMQFQHLAELGSAECGDGVLQGTERCDDGNIAPNDGCNSQCLVEKGYDCTSLEKCYKNQCGDGYVTGTEKCDDGNLAAYDGCSAKCTLEQNFKCEESEAGLTICARSICGDGKLEGREKCDGGGWMASGCKQDCSGPQVGRKCKSVLIEPAAGESFEPYYKTKCTPPKSALPARQKLKNPAPANSSEASVPVPPSAETASSQGGEAASSM